MPCSCGGLLDGLEGLHVSGEDEAGHGAFGLRNSQRPVDEVPYLVGGRDHVDVLVRDVLEQRQQVDLLLIVAAERRASLLADDGDHRLVVELGVVEAVEQVDRARPRRGEADADLPGELRVAACHEGGHLLVAGLNELDSILCPRECADDAVDPVPRVAVDTANAPFVEAPDQEVGDELSHRLPRSRRRRCRRRRV